MPALGLGREGLPHRSSLRDLEAVLRRETQKRERCPPLRAGMTENDRSCFSLNRSW